MLLNGPKLDLGLNHKHSQGISKYHHIQVIDRSGSMYSYIDELIDNIQQFLIELGSGFAFVGKQFEITVAEKSYYIDLLFYHIKLKRYVVIKLKTGEFEPEHAGKLNFYVTTIDKQLRDDSDNATIGLIICKTKNNIIAEYSLTDLHKPLGISSYELKKILPKNFKYSLPSIEEIENELKNL
jgi:hypothetical protein